MTKSNKKTLFWSATELHNEYLKSKFSQKSETDFWRGSDFGRCLRMRIYSRKRVPKTEELTLQQMRKLEQGNIIHWYWQRRFEDLGILVAKEMELKDEKLNYCGHFDALVNIGKIKHLDLSDKPDNWFTNFLRDFKKKYEKTGDHLLLYDIKSQHSLTFTYLQERGRAQPHHIMQIASYLVFAKREFPSLSEGRILYSSKDDGRVLECPVILTKKLEEKVFEELELLNFHWKKGTLPERLPSVDYTENPPKINWQCKFCPYSSYCKGANWLEKAKKELKEFLKTGAKPSEEKETEKKKMKGEKPLIPSKQVDFSKI